MRGCHHDRICRRGIEKCALRRELIQRKSTRYTVVALSYLPFTSVMKPNIPFSGLCAGRFFAHYYSDDPVAAYWAMRQKAVLYDVPERPLEVSGPDALHFLEMIFSRKISNLKVGRGYYTIACTFGGGIFMDGILFRLAPDRYWFVQPDGRSGKILAAVSAGRGTVRAETCRGHRTARRRLERRSLCE